MKPFFKGLIKYVIPWALPIILVSCWQLLSLAGIIPSRILPAPTQVFLAGFNLMASGELIEHISVSLARALTGLLIGGSIGFIIGLCNGVSRTCDLLLDTSIQMLRNIPHLALIPLVILWFGIDETAKVFFGSFRSAFSNIYKYLSRN